MSAKKLKNAPLKEVIFELRWEGTLKHSGIPADEEFDLAQGRFALKMESEFPVHKKLYPDNPSLKIFGSPKHQYWKGELSWPVVQHGEGMIAINDVEKNYEWENAFFPLIISTIDKLHNSYKGALRFNRVKLQFIDAWDIEEGHPVDFMKENLQTEISTQYQVPGKLRDFNIQQGFELNDGSILILSVSSGINNQSKKNSLVWNTVVEKAGRIKREDITTWLTIAHNHTSEMFKNMLKPDFYASLDR